MRTFGPLVLWTGIGEELEMEMKELIANYHCEWKKVVENPVLRERYRHFINDEDQDSTLSFVELRDQKIPVDWNKKIKYGYKKI